MAHSWLYDCDHHPKSRSIFICKEYPDARSGAQMVIVYSYLYIYRLIAEHLFIHTTAGVTIHWMYLAVLLPTVLIAIWTKSLSLTVLVGVMLMGTARWFF